MRESRLMEIRTVQNNPMRLEGYAIVFDTPTLIGTVDNGYEEIILPTALTGAQMSDVALIYNHDLNKVPLARVPNTMQLTVDSKGLKFVAELPDTEDGRSIYEAVKRGDLQGCSFAFTVRDGGEEWQSNRRIIRQIDKVYEISVTMFPAYPETSIEARNRINQKVGGNTMKFNDVAESFNYYANQPVEVVEKRINEIEQEIKTNKASASTLIEYEGVRQVKLNFEQRSKLFNGADVTFRSVVTGMDADGTAAIKLNSDDEIFDTKEYRAAFYKQLQGKELTGIEQRAMKIARSEFEKRSNEFNTSTNSAAIIPTATLDEIVKKARTQGGLLAECRAFAVPSKVAIPIGTPSTKAAWHVEGAAVETEKVVPTNVVFDGNEILKVFSISAKVQSMSIGAFESYLTDELEACVMDTIADSLVNGTGSGQGTGIMSTFTTATTITAQTKIDYSDVVNTVAKLKRGYANGAKWAMNNHTLYTVFFGMTDTTKRPIFIADPKSEGIGKILGFDVVVDDNIANNVVIFGNFNYMGYNLPSGIVIETSRESSFKSGLIDYRALAVADTKPLVNEAFVKLTVA